MDYPKIRAISAFPIELEEGHFICLQDPERYVEQPVIVSPELFSVIQFFDGKHSLQGIQEAYTRHYAMQVTTEQIRHIIEQLDQYLLLETPAFFAHVNQLRAEFAAMPVRPSSHQGAAYPDEKDALIRQLETYFAAEKGPGALPKSGEKSSDSLKAILAPHIDLQAGGPTYAWAYHALAASDADVFVILGTSHVGMDNFFALTRKSFETPFGQATTDQAVVDALAQQLPYDPFEDELIHKSEHSIEFQVVFLQYVWETLSRSDRPLKIVPILCGGAMHEAIYFNQPVSQVPQVEESVAALRAVLADVPGTCLVASVDLSHVGLRYDDPEAPDAEKLRQVQQSDQALLTTMQGVNPREFVSQLQRTRNETQVCGVVPIYTMLRLLEGTQGTLLHYDQAELGTGSFVSFASMLWNAIQDEWSRKV